MSKKTIFLLTNSFLVTNVIYNLPLCQVSNDLSKVFHVVNGNDVLSKKYNWFGIVKPKSETKVTKVGGAGTLINQQWVLTAAHVAWELVIKRQQHLKVDFGVYDLDNYEKKYSYDVEKVIFHPDYVYGVRPSSYCDLALLYLSQPVKNIQPIRMMTSNEKLLLNTQATLLGFGVTGINNNYSQYLYKSKLQEAKIEVHHEDKIKQKFGKEKWLLEGYNSETDLFAGSIENKRVNTGPGDSGGPLVQIINNETVLVGVVKGGTVAIKNFWAPRPSIFVDVSKTFEWVASELETKSTEEVLKDYHHSSYKDIFNDPLNPGAIYEMNGPKIVYDWTGSYGSPTWGKLWYRFDGSYAFLIYMYIRQNQKFLDYIKHWSQTAQITNRMKMEILYHFVFKTLLANFNDIRSLYWFKNISQHFNGFMHHFYEYFDISKNRYHKIIKASLFYKVFYLGKDKNARWVNEYLDEDSTNEPESWNLEHDRAYDAGLNFFIDYHGKNPGILADIFYKGSSWTYPVLQRDQNHPFKRPKEIISERTSGGSNYLSWIDFNNGSPIKRFHRPGKNIYGRDEL